MEKSSRTKNSIRNIITGFGGHLLITVLGFIVRTVFIYTLGKSYLGLNGLFSNILTMLSLTELGFGTAISFRLYKPLAEEDDKRVRVLLKFIKQAYRVVGVVILVIGICLIPTLPYIIKDYNSLEVLGVNATLIFMLHIFRNVSSYLFFAYRSIIMQASQKQYVLDIVGFVITLLTSIFKILVLVIWSDFVLYTASVIVFNILQNLINAVIAKRYFPQFFIKEEDSISKEEVWDMLKDCGALFLYRVYGVVLNATGNILISIFIGLATVGIYSNYMLFSNTINGFFNKIFFAIRASAGNLFATETVEKQYAFFQIMNYLSILLYGTAGVGIAICADELLTVWIGEEYVIKSPFALLLGLGIVFNGLKVNLAQIRNISGTFRQLWFRPVVSIILNLGITIWAMQVYGIIGVIIGTVVTDIMTNFLIDPYIIHKYSFDNFRPISEYYNKIILYILVLVMVYIVNRTLCSILFINHGWFSLIVHGIIVVVTVPGSLLLLYWKSHECRYLVNVFNRILMRVVEGKKIK